MSILNLRSLVIFYTAFQLRDAGILGKTREGNAMNHIKTSNTKKEKGPKN